MPRTIPETPEPGKRWAEEHSGFWGVYKEWHPPSSDGFWLPKRYRNCIGAELSESDARLLVYGREAAAVLRKLEWDDQVQDDGGLVHCCPWCGEPQSMGHLPNGCRLAALIANLEGG